jgi:hypothetical protein
MCKLGSRRLSAQVRKSGLEKSTSKKKYLLENELDMTMSVIKTTTPCEKSPGLCLRGGQAGEKKSYH